MRKNEKDDLDIQAILTQIVNQFDNISTFNDGQLEINRLLLEMLNTLEKRIEQLEERNAELEDKIKAVEKLATI